MTDAKQALLEIDKILSKITVSGDSVMLMAAARQKMNQLYSELEKDVNN